MGKLYEFQPTIGMTVAERTNENYYLAIKKMIKDNENLFTNHLIITYDDTALNIILAPNYPNISERVITIVPNTGNVTGQFIIKTNVNNAASVPISLNNDPTIFIKSDNDGFFIGYDNYPFIVGVAPYTNYDDETGGVEMFIHNSASQAIYVAFISNSNSISYNSATLNGLRYGDCNNYAIKPFTFTDNFLITSMFYHVDGGTDNPNKGMIFSIKNNRFVAIQGSLIAKI